MQPIASCESFKKLFFACAAGGPPRRLPREPGLKAGVPPALLGEGIAVVHPTFPKRSDASKFSEPPASVLWAKNTSQGVVLHAIQIFIHVVCQHGMIDDITIISYWKDHSLVHCNKFFAGKAMLFKVVKCPVALTELLQD